MRKTIASIAGLGVLLGVGYLSWRNSTPACPSLAQLTAQVQQHPTARRCANVTVAIEGCTVRLQGRMENAAQRTSLREAIQKLPGITQVHDTPIQLVGPPFCDVLDVLEPIQKRPEAQGNGLEVTLVNKPAGTTPVYIQGEHLVLQVTTPRTFESYLYVDYYTVDGQVQHLFPNPQEVSNFFRPRSVYVVGQLDKQHMPWKVLPPFGQELLTVIASKQPLVFTSRAPRYDPEPANLYINQLLQALPKGKAPTEVATVTYLIETRGKP